MTVEEEVFEDKICKDLELNLKLLIPTMIATIGADMYGKKWVINALTQWYYIIAALPQMQHNRYSTYIG